MKKVKRKYTRHIPLEAPQIATESISDSVKEVSSSKIPIEADTHDLVGRTVVYNSDKTVTRHISEFSFEDLPLSTRTFVNRVIQYRKAKGLPDDSKIRKERAIKYFRGDRPR